MRHYLKALLSATAALVQIVRGQANGPEYVNIAVGENPNEFVHPSTPAPIGSLIIWIFTGQGSQNHSVIQSTYEQPCQYLDGGFNSGLISVPAHSNSAIYFSVFVNNTDPIYYYSGGLDDCKAGMVGVVNPPCTGNGINSSGTFIAYQSLAEEVTSVVPPPSAIRGGQLASDFPTVTPTGSGGPRYTGFSASCTVGVNSTSTNSTSSTITSSVSSATSAPSSVSTSGDKSVYDFMSFRNQKLGGIWLGLLIPFLMDFL